MHDGINYQPQLVSRISEPSPVQLWNAKNELNPSTVGFFLHQNKITYRKHLESDRALYCHPPKKLVGVFNPSEKYESNWVHLPQVGVTIKNIWNHHPVIFSETNIYQIWKRKILFPTFKSTFWNHQLEKLTPPQHENVQESPETPPPWFSKRVHSLKPTAGSPPENRPFDPKGNDRIPTIHFQVRTVSFREGIFSCPKVVFVGVWPIQKKTKGIISSSENSRCC